MQIESRKKKLCLEPLRGIITQGEKMADTVIFRLPATYGALILSDLSWQIRAASEKNTLVTADLTASSGGEFCLVQWEVSADFTAVSGALSLMLVGTDSAGNVVIKFPGDDPIWIRDSETGEYAPPPDALEQAVIGIQQAQAALESAQESLEDAAQALQNTTANFRILGHYDSLPELQSAITNPSVGDAYGVGDPTVVYVWNGSAWTQLPGVLVSPSLPMSVANGGTGGTTITQALANLGAQASNNLLVNPRFKYNSRSQQSYSSSSGDFFSLDGWAAKGDTGAVSVSANSGGGITLTTSASNQGIKQLVYKKNLPNGTYTISILVNGTVCSETFAFSGSDVVNSYSGQEFSYAVVSATSDTYIVYPLVEYLTTQQSYTITAVKLERGSVSTLQAELDNPPPEDVEKLKLDMYDLDPGRCAYLPWHNENLLDNWYFVGGGSQRGGGQFPINQRGKTEYTGAGNTVDRWESNASSTLVSVVPDGISISVNNQPIDTQWILNQLLESYSSLAGKTVTVSLALRVTSGSVNVRFFDGTKAYISRNATSSDLSVISVSGTVSNSPTQMAVIVINQTENADFTLVAAKLELGYLSTLARKDEEGNWVLNDSPPNFQQELAKCQRYQVELVSTADPEFGSIGVCMGDSGSGISNFAIAMCPLPVPMRIKPTVITSGLFTLKKSPNVLNVSSIAVDRLSENAISLNVTVQGTVSIGEIYQLWYNPGSGKCSLLLDANL